MFLFESSASFWSRRFGLRDTVARFSHDLATRGVPMSLASVRAATDVVGRKRTVARPAEAAREAGAKLPIGSIAGLP